MNNTYVNFRVQRYKLHMSVVVFFTAATIESTRRHLFEPFLVLRQILSERWWFNPGFFEGC